MEGATYCMPLRRKSMGMAVLMAVSRLVRLVLASRRLPLTRILAFLYGDAISRTSRARRKRRNWQRRASAL
ncbi:hypothetical protein BD309DRAFT_973707 [Dichomitus squalens]|nr:hypothetical protein BD309DRAFT_973707 [Dichomitus squalens]